MKKATEKDLPEFLRRIMEHAAKSRALFDLMPEIGAKFIDQFGVIWEVKELDKEKCTALPVYAEPVGTTDYSMGAWFFPSGETTAPARELIHLYANAPDTVRDTVRAERRTPIRLAKFDGRAPEPPPEPPLPSPWEDWQ